MADMIKIIWGLTIAMQCAVIALMLWKKQYRDFPAIFAYVLINLALAPILYLVYSIKGYGSWPAFWSAWVAQAIVVIARWAAVCELCRNVFEQFQGIWALTWRALAVLGGIALLVAILLGGHDFVRLVTTLDLGLEISMSTVLVVFFLFARYYKVPMETSFRSIGTAFCLYSIFRAFNDLVLQTFLRNYANTWTLVDEVTYFATLVLLGSAIYVWRPESVRKVILLPRTAYAELAPKVNQRLEALNERLGQLLNTKETDKA